MRETIQRYGVEVWIEKSVKTLCWIKNKMKEKVKKGCQGHIKNGVN